MRFQVVAAVAAATLGATAVGCSGPSSATQPRGAKAQGGGLTVAASVAPIVNIVRNVVGNRDRVVGLIPEGVDSHTFEPSAATAKALSGADVIFLDGLHLEDPTLK